jgi:hypothetical protein
MNIRLQNWLNKWLHIVPPLGWQAKYEAQRFLKKLIITRPVLPPCSCYYCNMKELQEIASGKRRSP